MNIGPTSVGPADDAGLAACLLAVDPDGLGGISLRSAYGPAVERFLGLLRALLPAGTPVRKMPIQIPESRLLGGLDLAATLHAGRPVFAAGLLADADGGCIVIPMAERLPSSAAAILATALDTKDLTIERDGFARRTAMRFGVVALDEGCASDERPPAALMDRLALHLDLSALHTVPFDAPYDRDRIDAARRSAAEQSIDEAVIAALCETAMAFGIHSARAPWFATRVARLHAALAGRKSVGNDDAIVACRLVLAPRATRLPAFDSGETPAKQDEPEPHDDNVPAAQPNNEDGQTARAEEREQGELLVEATRAAIPPELLASMREHKMTNWPRAVPAALAPLANQPDADARSARGAASCQPVRDSMSLKPFARPRPGKPCGVMGTNPGATAFSFAATTLKSHASSKIAKPPRFLSSTRPDPPPSTGSPKPRGRWNFCWRTVMCGATRSR